MTKEDIFSLKTKEINKEIYDLARKRWDSISKPLDGLGDFEKVTAKILAINETVHIDSYNKALVIMCADHGIVEEGVSQCGSEVTLSVAKLLGKNKSTASKMAMFAGTKCIAVDIGINTEEHIEGIRACKIRKGTSNFLKSDAMTEDEAILAIETGIKIAKELKDEGVNILATGEMGIGNTTSGTAVLCGLTNVDVETVVGRGAGLSDEGLIRKTTVIKEALKKHGLNEDSHMKDSSYEISREYVLSVLRKVGGLELAGMTGLFIGGGVYGIPVMIDGVLSAVSALIAERILPGCKEYMIPSHKGREQGTGFILELLGLEPFINGDMALGEGSGALMTMPLLDMALDFYNSATTFDEGNITQYERL